MTDAAGPAVRGHQDGVERRQGQALLAICANVRRVRARGRALERARRALRTQRRAPGPAVPRCRRARLHSRLAPPP